MQKVTAENSCLEIAPGLHRGVLHDGYDDPNSGFLGMAPAVCKPMRGVPIEMDAGDVLCFHQKTPHRALQNRSDWVRWSIDMRYEATEKATLSGRDKGLIARSSRAPSSVTSYEQWLQQWEAVPAGAY